MIMLLWYIKCVRSFCHSECTVLTLTWYEVCVSVCVCFLLEGGSFISRHISGSCHCLTSGFYSRPFVLIMRRSLDPNGQICFILFISHRVLSYLKHTRTHDCTCVGLWPHSRKRRKKVTWRAHLCTQWLSWLWTRGWMPQVIQRQIGKAQNQVRKHG